MFKIKKKRYKQFFSGLGGSIRQSRERKAVQYQYRIMAAENGFELFSGDLNYIEGLRRDLHQISGETPETIQLNGKRHTKDVAYGLRLKALDIGHELVPGDRESCGQLERNYELLTGRSYDGKV